MKRALLAVAALAATALSIGVTTTPAGADGTETLGPPAFSTISSGTGVAVGGVGLTGRTSGTLQVSVPEGATVRQVMLHWAGLHKQGTSGDGTITVNGVSTTGQRIGGPTYWYRDYYVTSYRAFITSRKLIKAGANSLSIGGVQFNVKNTGVGATVIYDDGSAEKATIGIRDGIDLAQADFPAPRKGTVAQTFTFPASSTPRQAAFLLQVGDIGTNRPHQVVVTAGSQTTVLHSPLSNVSGPEWDAVRVPVDIPAGATTASIELVSGDPGAPGVPASILWVAAGIDVPPPVVCVTSPNPAQADGRAFGLQASLLNGAIPIPATPDTEVKNPDAVLTLDVPPAPDTIVSDTLLKVANDPSVTATEAKDVAMAVTNEVSIPAAGVSAKTVVARSTSFASGTSAGSTFAGSVVQDLVVGGTLIGDVTHPQTHTVKDPATGNVVVQVDVFETTRSGAAAGVVQPEGATSSSAGDYRSGLGVNALRVRTFDPLLGVLINDIVVGHASSEASFPSAQRCEPQPHVVGEAFTSKLANLDPNVAESVTGLVVLPSTGGSEAVSVLTLAPISAGTGKASTKGTLAPLEAESAAEVADVDLGGQILAKAVSAWTKSGTGSPSDTGGALLLDLVLGGTNVCEELEATALCSPAPNTYFPAAPPDTIVVLNEQIPTGTGGLTVNAVHIYIVGPGNPYGLPVGAELIISSATSDAVPVS